MKRAMTQSELQETPGPRQRRQHIGGLLVSLPQTAVDFRSPFALPDVMACLHPQLGEVNSVMWRVPLLTRAVSTKSSMRSLAAAASLTRIYAKRILRHRCSCHYRV